MSPWALWLLCASCVAGIYAQSDAKWKNSRSYGVSEVIPNQKVLILTMPRSGSSFVGEVFQQNPEFMYLFEPERGFSEYFANDACSPKPADPVVETVTKALFNCDFAPLKQYTDSHSWRGDLYTWARISAFSGKDKTKLCLPPNSTSPEAREMSVAVKEIEMWAPKINWLHEILGPEFHLIWLVRDVRGWVSSWLVNDPNFFTDWGYDKLDLWARYSQCEMLTCGGILDQTKIAKIKGILTNNSSAPHLKMAAWWTIDTAVSHFYFSRFKGKMLLVKYEDMSTQPFETVQQIYSFMGRRVHEKVVRYLAWATKEGDVDNRYDTYRYSAAMADVWRTRLCIP